ncbi:DedA family protein [Dissulfurirhabdus thermomarina]|uniref:DedA family protein n=1 Tax=Dissulfurirhabdus thermomarina TaxID=1765737 RepID=A0A6N9TPL4_DISTH|nr:VTT domain-containing protein [Dissulfurirhabdus thermomarina]NDY43109.1 DedA family protein [Dissulfurirhabdus thermomarina]NMX24449.1 DedA family protein [Dissulfurirhabdus thermomarina]
MEGLILRRAALFLPGQLRRLYDWVLSWADHPRAGTALALLAFAEASFFPIPPDVLLIALALARREGAFRWAGLATAGSVAGGALGYFIGWQFMAAVGGRILAFYHLTEAYETVRVLFHRYDAWAVAAAGFTPIPYKLFTIAAGAFGISLPTFLAASLLSRGARFFLVAGLVYVFGPPIRAFLERYFNLCTLIFAVLLVGGFLVLKWML